MPDAQVVATSRWLRLRSGRARAGTGSAVGRSYALAAETAAILAEVAAPDSPTVITAALDEPLAAMLTIIRACDQAKNVWLAAPPIWGAPTETGP